MKEISTSANKHSRPIVYPKKRPTPHGGITKSRKTTTPADVPSKTPASQSVTQQLRQREAHIAALRQNGALLEEEYQEDIELYMHDMERYTMSSPTSMEQQPEIRWHMRPCLVDFLVEIHFTFRLRPETLYLTLNIIDRYVSRRIVYIKHYQLVGVTALWIAAKFEDAKERVPTVQELVQICRDTYEESAFIQMEGHLLSTIQWTLGHPTAESWLRLFCCTPSYEDAKVQNVARFLMEITLFYRDFVCFPSSAIARGALTLARFLCGKTHRISAEDDECKAVIERLDNRLGEHINDLSETLIKKYSYAFYSKASTFVLQYYLNGGRFNPLPVTPSTPTRSSPSPISTPGSASTTASDWSDDGPQTPCTPPGTDPFATAHPPRLDKENQPSTYDNIIVKHRIDSTPDSLLPHDYVTLSRPALHTLNIASPRVVVS